MSWTTHRARILCAALVATALVVVGVRSATDRTAAAWTNDVHTATDVALGSWGSTIASCTLVDENLDEVADTCPEFTVEGNLTSEQYPPGSRRGNLYVKPVTPKEGRYRILLTLDLSQWDHTPADWEFDGGWFTQDALEPWPQSVPKEPCADLPLATVLLPAWASNSASGVYFQLFERGWPDPMVSPVYCQR